MMERSADVNDNASELESEERNAAIAAARSKLRESHRDFDGEHCLDCGDEMIPERLALGRIRCVYCQHSREVKAKRGLR